MYANETNKTNETNVAENYMFNYGIEIVVSKLAMTQLSFNLFYLNFLICLFLYIKQTKQTTNYANLTGETGKTNVFSFIN